MKMGLVVLALCCAVLFCAGAATAQDEVGAIGSVAGLQINNQHGDTYLLFHGRMYVKNGGGTLDEYRWGGTSCGSRVLTEDEMAALHRALDNKKMQIQPLFQIGQGDMKCVVGFTLVPKKNLALGIP